VRPAGARCARWLAAAVVLVVLPASGQPDAAMMGRAAAARVDLAVPEGPAYGALGQTPGIIMRPGTVREVSAIVSQLLDASPDLPRSFGVELAPALLLSGNDLTLARYRQMSWLYRMRISAASALDRGDRREVAFGLRFSLLDGSDLRTDDSLNNALLRFAEQIRDAWEEAVETIRPPAGDVDPAELHERRERAVKAKLGTSVERQIVEARSGAQRRLWNARILEAGLAMKAGGGDSTYTRLHAERYALWLTGGFPLGSAGFLLAGCNGSIERATVGMRDHQSFSTALRACYGSNGFKGSLEANGRWASTLIPEFGVNLGGEVRLANGFWADVSVGITGSGKDGATIQTSFNVRIATPEEQSGQAGVDQ
jgi:hypothetical protein